MPVAHHMDPNIKIVYLMIYGHCLFGDVMKPASTPEYGIANRPKMKFIMDFRKGDLEIDTDDKLVISFINAFELMVDDTKEVRKVFTSLDEAIDWLGETEHTQTIHRIHDELLAKLRSASPQP